MYHKISHFLSSQTGPTRFFFTTLGEAYNNAARRSRKRLRLHDRTRYVWRPAISTRTQPGERSLGRRGGRRGAARGRPRRSRPNKNGAVDPGASQASTLATPRRRRSPFRTEHLDIHTRCMHTYSMHAYILDVHTYRLRRLGGGGDSRLFPGFRGSGGPGRGRRGEGGNLGGRWCLPGGRCGAGGRPRGGRTPCARGTRCRPSPASAVSPPSHTRTLPCPPYPRALAPPPPPPLLALPGACCFHPPLGTAPPCRHTRGGPGSGKGGGAGGACTTEERGFTVTEAATRFLTPTQG